MSPYPSEPLCKLHLRYVKAPLWLRHLSPAPPGAIRLLLSALCSHSTSLQGASCSTRVPDCFGINSAKAHTRELGRRQLQLQAEKSWQEAGLAAQHPPGMLPGRRQRLRILLLSKGSAALGSLEEGGSQCSSSVVSKCHLCHQREQGSALVLGCK